MKALRLIGVVLASAGAGAGLAMWLSLGNAPRHVTPSLPADELPNETARRSVTVPSPAPRRPEEAQAQVAADLHDLRELQAACPSLVGKLAEECASALERRFAGNSEWYPRTVLLPELTAADIFALTESTLAGVQGALSRPECQVPAGRFRADLRESCAADEMAKLALLHRKCSEWVDADPDRTKRLHVETMLDEARWDVEPKVGDWLDEENYLRMRSNNEAMAYANAWTYHKCQARRIVLEWRGLALDHVRDISGGPPVPFQPYGGHTMWLSNPLLRAAIRVGSELALMQLPLHPRQIEEEPLASMFAELEAHNPTLAHVKMAQTALSDTKTLAHAMAAQMLAPLQGLNAAWRRHDAWRWQWTEEGAWHSSFGGRDWFTADEHKEATEKAERIVARIAEQQGWDATNLDWTRVAAPMELPATRD